MGQEGQGAAAGLAAFLELLVRDEHGGREAAGDQEAAHDQRRGRQQLAGVGDPAPRVLGRVVGAATDQGHQGDPGLEPRQAQSQFREDEQGHRDHGQGAAVTGGQQLLPVHNQVGVGDQVLQGHGDHDEIES